MEEIWRGVKEYETLYQISTFGRVKSLIGKTKILKPSKYRYARVTLHKNTKVKYFTVHALVAQAFLNHNIDNYTFVINHLDFNGLNNNVLNLEITTQRKNANLKHKKTSSEYTGVSLYSRNKWVSKIWVNGKSKYLGLFKKEIDAHNAYQTELKKLSIPS